MDAGQHDNAKRDSAKRVTYSLSNLPWRMMGLKRDKRSYPVPFIVFLDDDGEPHFTINDARKALRCKTEDVCAICGQKLLRGRWFIGGPMSALAPTGAYIDPPLHHECMQFAASVCPYLISAKYRKRIDGATLDMDKAKSVVGLYDPTVMPERPPIFVGVMAIGQTYTPNGYVVPRRPYRKMEFWRNGELMREFTAEQIALGFAMAEKQFRGMLDAIKDGSPDATDKMH